MLQHQLAINEAESHLESKCSGSKTARIQITEYQASGSGAKSLSSPAHQLYPFLFAQER